MKFVELKPTIHFYLPDKIPRKGVKSRGELFFLEYFPGGFAKSRNGIKLRHHCKTRNNPETKMSQQHAKCEKRARRKAYLARCKSKVRAAIAATSKKK